MIIKTEAQGGTYRHDVEEHPSHVVAVPFVVVRYMAVVMEVRRMTGRMVRLEVVVMSELVVWRDR